MALTNEEKNFIADCVRHGIKFHQSNTEIISRLMSYGYKQSTIKKYIKAYSK